MSGMELRVGNKYRLGRKIGSGSFGDIYLGNWYQLQLYFLIILALIFFDVFKNPLRINLVFLLLNFVEYVIITVCVIWQEVT